MQTSTSSNRAASLSLPPKPRGFICVSKVEWAHLCDRPGFAYNGRARSPARRAGQKYEASMQKRLDKDFGLAYLPGPWLRFLSVGDTKPSYCQPDGLLFLPEEGKLVLVEIKLKHCTEAWWQLKYKYLPVVEAIFPPDLWAIAICEVVKWFDPSTAFPEKVKLTPYVDKAPFDSFGVHICGKP